MTFTYKFNHLYDMANSQEYINLLRKALYDLITIFGDIEVSFLEDNASHNFIK